MRSRTRPLLYASLIFGLLVAALEAESYPISDPLLSLETDQSAIDLFILGSWKLSLLSSCDLTFLDSGSSFSVPTPFMLNQSLDLSLEAIFDKQWFVTVSADDNSYLKELALGYQAETDQLLRQLVIGNRLPAFPIYRFLGAASDLAGAFDLGKPALGMFIDFGGAINKTPLAWSAQALITVDDNTRQELNFRGGSLATRAEVNINDRQRGLAFILPDDRLDSLPEVFIEDPDGSYLDADGRRFRRLAASDYAASQDSGWLEFNQPATALVAVSYRKHTAEAPWKTSLGSYRSGGADSQPGLSVGSGFLGSVQAWFDSGLQLDLAAYPQCGGGDGQPASLVINGQPALAIYQPGCFSPFERADLYPIPAGFSLADGWLEKSFGINNSDFILLPYKPLSSYISELAAVQPSTPVDSRSAESRFPLAALAPWAYLADQQPAADSPRLIFQASQFVGHYDIGPGIAADTIRVFRDGLRDNNFHYDPISGIVNLQRPASSLETIRISYLEANSSALAEAGFLSAALGASLQTGPYRLTSVLSLRQALSDLFNWPNLQSQDQASTGLVDGNRSTTGSLAATAGFSYTGEEFQSQTAISVLSAAPSKAFIRLAGMEEASFELTLNHSTAQISEVPTAFPDLPISQRASLIYRDYHHYDLWGSSSLAEIESSLPAADPKRQGPYLVAGPEGTSTALAAEFRLDEDRTWTGFQVHLGSKAIALTQAESLSVRLRCLELAQAGDFQVIMQIGSLADPERGQTEADWLIWQATILDTDTDRSSLEGRWTTVEFNLNAEDRRRLADARLLRLVIIRQQGEVAGRILMTAPQIQAMAFRPVIWQDNQLWPASNWQEPDGFQVQASEIADPELAASFPSVINQLQPQASLQRVWRLTWEKAAFGLALGLEQALSLDSFENYRSLSFFFRPPAADFEAYTDSYLNFILANSADPAQAWFKLSLPLTAFDPDCWAKVRVQYDGEPQAFINEQPITVGQLVYKPYYRAVSQTEAVNLIILSRTDSEATLGDGSFSIDEIFLEQSLSHNLLSLNQKFHWQREAAILSFGATPLLSELSASLAAEGQINLDQPNSLFRSQVSLGASLWQLKLQFDGSLGTSSKTDLNWKAAHTAEFPNFPLKLKESFAYDPINQLLDHSFQLQLASPLALTVKSFRSSLVSAVKRSWLAELSTGSSSLVTKAESGALWKAQVGAGLVYTGPASPVETWSLAYPLQWLESWSDLLPDDGFNQNQRQCSASAGFTYRSTNWGFNVHSEAMGTAISDKQREGRLQLRLELPLQPKNWELNLNFRRELSTRQSPSDRWPASLDNSGRADIFSDGDFYRAAFLDASALLFSLPAFNFYDHRQSELLGVMAEGRSAATLFDRAEINLKPPKPTELSGLWLPASLKASVKRSLEHRLDNFRDQIDLETQAAFTALNLFGAYGTASVCDWYKTDEFYQRYLVAIAFQPEKLPISRFSCEQGAFFRSDNTVLQISNFFRLAEPNWSDRLALSLSAPADNSITKRLFSATLERLAELQQSPYLASLATVPLRSERRGSFELNLSGGGEFSWDCRFSLASSVRATGRISLALSSEITLTEPPGQPLVVSSEAGLTLIMTF